MPHKPPRVHSRCAGADPDATRHLISLDVTCIDVRAILYSCHVSNHTLCKLPAGQRWGPFLALKGKRRDDVFV
ncbi:hypothetical protein AXF42_Ash008783 [Apostasia shenzhenica]|uniref:Uncharacterized protein n=1 Tax=Apostasia shenzhenica TaxID=1088818 RepID=A0A2I0ASP2_9ASPA|nr:hypothetical protein AXF42_Ash008783 [Apostasia shenzhenica]